MTIYKEYGKSAVWLNKYLKNRGVQYRNKKEVFEDYTQEKRDRLFGRAPATVWENIKALDSFPEKTAVLKYAGVMTDIVLESYKYQVISQWKTELHDRLIPNNMALIRGCHKLHEYDGFSDLDDKTWKEIDELRHEIGKDTLDYKCLLTRTKEALDNDMFDEASEL